MAGTVLLKTELLLSRADRSLPGLCPHAALAVLLPLRDILVCSLIFNKRLEVTIPRIGPIAVSCHPSSDSCRSPTPSDVTTSPKSSSTSNARLELSSLFERF